MGTRSTLMVCILTLTALPDDAQINWSDDPAEWPQIKEEKGKVSKGAIDFDDDFWFDVVGFKGPVGSAGEPTMPISPGVILDNVNFDTVGGSIYAANLVGVSPDGGFGNPSNTLLANYSVDSFQIELTEPSHTMVMLNLLSLIGSYTVDVSFYDKLDRLIGTVPGLPAPNTGHPVLFWTQRRETIGRIVIDDLDGGAEGIMQTEYWVPEPASLALLGVAVLVLGCRGGDDTVLSAPLLCR